MRNWTSLPAALAASATGALVALTAGATAAEAYIGPGVGAGAIAAVVGVLGSIFLALFAVIYYPVKRMLKKRKTAAGDPSNTDGA